MYIRHVLLILAVLIIYVPVSDAQSTGKLSGNMFGDYYYVVNNHNSDIEDANSFWLRRIYLTYDNNLNEDFSVRLRFEMNSAGDFTSDTVLEPSVKDAWLRYNINSNHQVLIGISSTPTWNVVESVWGYRSVEKTPLDLQKFGSSRDFGVALKGNVDADGKVKYHVMLGNGSSTKSETNKGKKVLLSFGFYPTESVIIEMYGDYNDLPGDTDQLTVQGFAVYKTDKYRVGIQYAHQIRRMATGDDLNLDVLSLFSAGKISEKVNLFARVDRMFEPNPQGEKIAYIPFDATSKSTFFVGGLDYSPIKNVKFIPNVEVVVYDENELGITPKSDVIPRVTFFYSF